MKIKQPRRLIAGILLLNIAWMLFLIAEKAPEPSLETVTGLSSTGTVSINIIARCNIPLRDGYNLISLCSNAANRSILKVLESINGQYEFVLRLNRTSQVFDVFSPSSATNGFTTFEENESYFIFMNQNSTLNIPGNEFGDMNISLDQEFNAISYPYQFTTNISTYISPISQNVSFVVLWNDTRQIFTLFSPEASVQDVEKIGRGNGQFVYFTVPSGVLRYNKSALNSSS